MATYDFTKEEYQLLVSQMKPPQGCTAEIMVNLMINNYPAVARSWLNELQNPTCSQSE